MRILYHHRTLGDGAEGVHIREMVRAFERQGNQVDIAALAGAGSSSGGGSMRSRALRGVKSALPEAAYECLQLAASTISTVEVIRRIRAFRPDFIYKRHARYDFGPVMAARLMSVPLILEVNCVYASDALRRFERVRFATVLSRIERWIFESASWNIVVSAALESELRSIGPSAPSIIMTNGVDHHRFCRTNAGQPIRRRLGFEHGTTIIGFVGTLWRWHGLDLLLKALQYLDNRDIRLLVVGDGETRIDLEREVMEGGLGNQVRFTGRVPHDAVCDYLNAVDIAVLPAEHRQHASPMKILEYMAVGLPTVAPRLPNIAEIIEDGTDGVLFAPNDALALAEAIRSLQRDPGLRARLGLAARQKIESRFNWDMNAQKTLELCAALTERDKQC